MINPERLAQALREITGRLVLGIQVSERDIAEINALLAEHDALASLAPATEVPCASCTSPRACAYHGCKGAPAAVEGDAVEIMWDAMRRVNAPQTPNRGFFVLTKEGVRLCLAEAYPALTAQVAALTAQCEALKLNNARYRILRAANGKLWNELAAYAMSGLDTKLDTIAAGNGEGV